MKIISVIDDEDIIKRILKHLSLWDSKPRPPRKPKDVSKKSETVIDDSFSQLPAPARRLSGGSDNWIYVDPQYPEDYSPFFSSIYYLVDASDALLKS